MVLRPSPISLPLTRTLGPNPITALTPKSQPYHYPFLSILPPPLPLNPTPQTYPLTLPLQNGMTILQDPYVISSR